MTPWHLFFLIVQWILAIGGGFAVGLFLLALLISTLGCF